MEKKKLIFDTSFLMDVLRFKIPLEEIFFIINPKEIIIPKFVIKELKKQRKKEAKLALKLINSLIKKKKVKVVSTKNFGDKGFFEIIDKNSIIATNDKELRKLLKKKKVKTLFIRNKKWIQIE